MNNFDYTIGWFTDWLDRVCVGKENHQCALTMRK